MAADSARPGKTAETRRVQSSAHVRAFWPDVHFRSQTLLYTENNNQTKLVLFEKYDKHRK